MILLDTHIWVWWVANGPGLKKGPRGVIDANQAGGLGVSVISCWEVAKKVEIGKLVLDRDVGEWIRIALSYPGVLLIDLSPDIVVESTKLPKPFHRDPADQMLVATARLMHVPILTADRRILQYPHVEKAAAPA